MAVNPLIVFVGLSVTTLGGLVAVVQQKKAQTTPEPAVVQSLPQTQAAPQRPSLVLPEKKILSQKTPAQKTPDIQKLASIEPKKQIEKQTPPVPETAKEILNPKPDALAVPVAPTFDMVRVEKDGGAVVAGKAAPGAEILLKLNGKVIGKSKANENGDWVFVPEQLVPQGSSELIVEATGKDKKTIRSKQSIFIAIPKGAKEKPLIVVTKPDAPTRVLQKPQAPETTTLITKSAPAKTDLNPIAEAIRPKQVSPPVVEKPVAPNNTQPPEKLASITAPKSTPKTSLKLAKPPLKAPKIAQSKLLFGTVDYNDRGEIVFTGKATAGSTVRLYVDNVFVGDAIADVKGNWIFRGKEQIKPGERELRADQLSANNQVVQRTVVPFVRAHPKKVAALLATRKKAAETPSAVKQKVAKKPPVSKPDAVEPKVVEQIVQPTPAIQKEKTTQASKPAQKPAQKPAPAKPVVLAAKQPATVSPPETTVPNAPARLQEKVADTTPVPAAPATADGTPAPADVTANPVANQETANPETELVSHVVIQPGNNLWNISRVIYGKGIAYTTIFQANQEQIKNPNRIYPGQIFTTPGTTSTGAIAPDQREPLSSLADSKTDEN